MSWRRSWQSIPVFLPGESHGQRILVGYSPWSHKENDWSNLAHTHTHTHTHTYTHTHTGLKVRSTPIISVFIYLLLTICKLENYNAIG